MVYRPEYVQALCCFCCRSEIGKRLTIFVFLFPENMTAMMEVSGLNMGPGVLDLTGTFVPQIYYHYKYLNNLVVIQLS